MLNISQVDRNTIGHRERVDEGWVQSATGIGDTKNLCAKFISVLAPQISRRMTRSYGKEIGIIVLY